jgi:hypothetical protein
LTPRTSGAINLVCVHAGFGGDITSQLNTIHSIDLFDLRWSISQFHYTR